MNNEADMMTLCKSTMSTLSDWLLRQTSECDSFNGVVANGFSLRDRFLFVHLTGWNLQVSICHAWLLCIVCIRNGVDITIVSLEIAVMCTSGLPYKNF